MTLADEKGCKLVFRSIRSDPIVPDTVAHWEVVPHLIIGRPVSCVSE